MFPLLASLWLSSCVESAAGPQRDAEPLARDAGIATPTPPPSLRLSRNSATSARAEDDLVRRFPAYGVALHYMANVYEAPRKDARIIGYLRRGALFRASEEVGRAGCARGFFEIPGAGFVCQGDGVRVDSRPYALDDSPSPPALSDPLPYRYGKVVSSAVPQFSRLPSARDEESIRAAIAQLADDAGVADVTTAPPTAQAAPSPALPDGLRSLLDPGFYVSLDRTQEADRGRSFERTVRGGFVRADQLLAAALPPGKGVALGHRYQLPLAFVYRGGAPALTLDPGSGELKKRGDELALHSAHQLTGETVSRAGRTYYVTREGLLIRDTAVRVVSAAPRPALLKRGERWIRVDLTQQTLTAYEGDSPVFATLVSSGLADHPTPSGLFRLHAKHVTATMADNLAADGPYSIEDVPWTMYFQGSYALHAAFWHDRFGHPRSHGCVNLAPRDARWLFFFTAPALPSAWHGVLADVGEGTAVLIEGTAPSP